MATQPKKMNIIKQVLTGHKNGISVRDLATMYSMSPTTVQRYIKMAKEDKLGIDALLLLDDPELNHRFYGGAPRLLVPDNLRSAVKTFDKWSPSVTDGLNNLATHYGCCTQPARVRKPKLKRMSLKVSSKVSLKIKT